MPQNVAQKLISSHLESGDTEPGSEIGLRIDQTLTQDATGTMVMLEFERIGLPEVRTELSAQYVDHNLLQADFRNADDHEFLRSACEKWGLWYSKPGNGVSHPVHQQRFGIPGKTLLGSDSHTPAAGSIGMLAIGAGGLEVAMAMAGEPMIMPMAKAVISRPAREVLTPRSVDNSGSSPAMTNSVVPIRNVPAASTRTTTGSLGRVVPDAEGMRVLTP